MRHPNRTSRHSDRSLTFTGALVLAAALVAASIPVSAQESPSGEAAGQEMPPGAATPEGDAAGAPAPDIDWILGPADGRLGDMATIKIPEGFVFAGADDTRKLMEASQNLTNGTEMGFLAPADDSWFIVFEYEDIGYVKDDEGAKLDGDAILASLREGNERGNEMRKERGWPTMELTGWAQPPHYDASTNNLEWALQISTDGGGGSVNYNTRLLGRSGVMSVTLVIDPEKLDGTLPSFKTLVSGHSFNEGQRYAEFKPGDKIAQYGLTALITGGAVAVALKTGLFQKFWKLIVVAVAGLAALAKKVFIRSEKAPPAPAV